MQGIKGTWRATWAQTPQRSTLDETEVISNAHRRHPCISCQRLRQSIFNQTVLQTFRCITEVGEFPLKKRVSLSIPWWHILYIHSGVSILGAGSCIFASRRCDVTDPQGTELSRLRVGVFWFFFSSSWKNLRVKILHNKLNVSQKSNKRQNYGKRRQNIYPFQFLNIDLSVFLW